MTNKQISFGKKNFRDKITVDWLEFMNALGHELQLVKSRTPIMRLFESSSPLLEGTTLMKDIICLRAIIAENSKISDKELTHVVNLENFGKNIHLFGPLIPAGKPNQFLDRVRNAVCSTWFHGLITTKDSEQLLITKPPGTFLVRFSTSSEGAFAISLVTLKPKTNQKIINHYRFTHDLTEDNYIIKIDNQVYTFPSITELIEGLKDKLELLQPCLGSHFTSIFMIEQNEGYVTRSKQK